MDEIEDMVETILNKFGGKWPTDITDLVFLAIENNPGYLKRYEMFANGEYGTANQKIGRFVKEFTGMKTLKEKVPAKSKLIRTFTSLTR